MTPQKYFRGISKKIAKIQKEKKLDSRKVEGPPGRNESSGFAVRTTVGACTLNIGLDWKKIATLNYSSILSGFSSYTSKQYRSGV